MKEKQKRHWLILGLILILGAIFRFYKLDSLPGEMFGDIVDGYQFTQEILRGKWPFYFILGTGPLFFYLVVTPLSWFFGLSFLAMKIASVVVGLCIIPGIFLLAKELFNARTAFLAAFLTAVSKWALVFSRWGNMNILVPLFTTLGALLFFKILKNPKNIWLWVTSGILLGTGMYNYPAYFIFPVAIYFLFLLQGPRFVFANFKRIALTSVIFLLLAIPFLRMFFGNLQSYTSSQSCFGHKIFVAGGKLAPNWPERLFDNVKKTVLMFNWEGDPGFRANPPSDPQLDPISGFFFLIGVITIFTKPNRRNKLNLLVLSVFLLIPEILVLNVPTSIPSATMTIGVFPLIYLIAALGIETLYEKTVFLSPKLKWLILIGLLITVALINTKKYFVDYAYHLPNHNEGFPNLIAREIDKLPNQTIIYMYGGGWGEREQPDRRAVYYEMRKAKTYVHIEKGEFSCSLFQNNTRSKYFILDPHSEIDLKEIQRCFPEGETQVHFTPKYHFPLFVSYIPI